MRRSADKVADQVARLEKARSAMMPDRRVLGEMDAQIEFLRSGKLTARVPDEVLAREEAERWLRCASDIEPAEFWERLASMWEQQKELSKKQREATAGQSA